MALRLRGRQVEPLRALSLTAVVDLDLNLETLSAQTSPRE
jgi:hypothetical protein